MKNPKEEVIRRAFPKEEIKVEDDGFIWIGMLTECDVCRYSLRATGILDFPCSARSDCIKEGAIRILTGNKRFSLKKDE